ncbi:MAG: tRNA pseudouridine(55) synthase TruB [Desulfuromonadaceae bacterium]|nr:tRNA pseudouridine(55) synthase TruB [Desulfuromonadaceae bacterium]
MNSFNAPPEGLLIIDKPAGMTSHSVVSRLRRLLNTRRIGHAGTLDPLATGVLVVAVGKVTRLLEFMVSDHKSYRGELQFGTTTDTLDREGKTLESFPLDGLDEYRVRRAAESFVGTIQQIPPMYSAIKQNGVALHKLARKGIEVERPPRTVTISRLDVISCDLPRAVIDVDCSKGTYIRTLCADLGEKLGVGAHLTELRRLSSGPFTSAEAIGLEALREQLESGGVPPLIAPLEALRGWVVGQINENGLQKVNEGVPPTRDDLVSMPQCGPGTRLALACHDELVAVARFAPERTRETRGDFELIKVFPRATGTF